DRRAEAGHGGRATRDPERRPPARAGARGGSHDGAGGKRAWTDRDGRRCDVGSARQDERSRRRFRGRDGLQDLRQPGYGASPRHGFRPAGAHRGRRRDRRLLARRAGPRRRGRLPERPVRRSGGEGRRLARGRHPHGADRQPPGRDRDGTPLRKGSPDPPRRGDHRGRRGRPGLDAPRRRRLPL
ncbi:MAG: hypothetical protein AVDCRST_MAG05-4221, partial [uncultured Rubrobacteraceae bacterium]